MSQRPLPRHRAHGMDMDMDMDGTISTRRYSGDHIGRGCAAFRRARTISFCGVSAGRDQRGRHACMHMHMQHVHAHERCVRGQGAAARTNGTRQQSVKGSRAQKCERSSKVQARSAERSAACALPERHVRHLRHRRQHALLRTAAQPRPVRSLSRGVEYTWGGRGTPLYTTAEFGGSDSAVYKRVISYYASPDDGTTQRADDAVDGWRRSRRADAQRARAETREGAGLCGDQQEDVRRD